MKLKQFIKKIIPRPIKDVKLFLLAFKEYKYDILRYVNHSNTRNRFGNSKKLRGALTMTYHAIEKGLTMPEMRLGFGKENVLGLCDLCKKYINGGYDIKALEFDHSVKILNEYLNYHQKNKYKIDENVKNEIYKIVNACGIKDCAHQPEMTRSEFNIRAKRKFNNFCKSRVTVRHYIDKEISDDIINDCLEMALKSPSACNRQPNKVYFLRNKEIKEKFLAIQNGNRGFGHLANVIAVFTTDLSVFSSLRERNEAYLNSGMFSMTFIYALHFYGIGSCALNLSVSNNMDKNIRQLLNIPENEVITMALSFGYVPDRFKYAQSPRLEIEKVKIVI